MTTLRLPMPLDVTLPFWFDRPAGEAIDIAMNAEAAGADELWVGEMTTWDGAALAAAIARTTSKVTIVLGPLAVKVRDAVSLAMAVSSVAALGNRPAHLAIGASSPVVVEQWHGRPYDRMGTAVIECFEQLRPMLAGGRGPGGYRLRLDPPGGGLRIAVFGPRLTRYAAQHADGVVLNMSTPEQVVPYRRMLDEAAAEAGGPRPVLATWMMAGIDPGPRSFQQAATQLVAYLHPPGYGEKMIEAGVQMGMTRRDELNHPDLEGIGYYSHTIHKGRRVSSAKAFLHPVRRRRNLTVVTEALVDRVVFTDKQAKIGRAHV